MEKTRIPIYKPFLGKKETEYVMECMDSTWISSQGKFLQEFEEGVQAYIGTRHAIAVSNGTVAIHLAMLALDIGPGDEVITTNFTYVASSNAILYVGATPVFVDIEADTWNLDPSRVEERIGPRTKAILYTNIYGAPANYNRLKSLALKYGLYLIEDAAESFGATYESKMSGTLGDIATFSFFGNKTITTGEGGMVLTASDNLAGKLRQLKNQGNSETIRYYHDILGYNYRMTNVQAAIGTAQLEKIHDILRIKANIQKRYEDGLGNLVEFQKIEPNATSSFWMCSILLKSQAEKEAVTKVLADENVETRPFFTPIDELPFYEKSDGCPISRDISVRGMNLPSYPELTESDQNRIISCVKSYIEKQ